MINITPISQAEEKINHETIINSLQISTPIPFHMYLKEIYSDLSSRSNEKTLTKLTFFSYYNLPGILGDRLFAVFDKSSKSSLTETDFIEGMETLFCGSFESTSKLIFDFYDFDKDGKIYSEDIRTVLSYITLTDVTFNKSNKYKGRVRSQEELYVILEKSFKNTNKPFLDYSSFQYVIENINSDIYFICILFLLESKPFSKANIQYFVNNNNNSNSSNNHNKKVSDNNCILHVEQTQSPITSIKNSPHKMVASPSKNTSFSPYRRFQKGVKRKTVVQPKTLLQKRFQMILHTNDSSNNTISNNKVKRFSNKRVNDDGFCNSNSNISKENKNDVKKKSFVMTCQPVNVSEKIIPFYEETEEVVNKEGNIRTKEKKTSLIIGRYQQLLFFDKDANKKRTLNLSDNNTTSLVSNSNNNNNNNKHSDEFALDDDSDNCNTPMNNNNNNNNDNSTNNNNNNANILKVMSFMDLDDNTNNNNIIINENINNNDDNSETSSINNTEKINLNSENDSDYDSQSESECVVTQEGYLFKLNNNKMKKVFFKLIHKDLYFYKTKSSNMHRGMHNLSGLFIKEEPIYLHEGTPFYCFSIIYPSKTRFYYHDDEGEYISWLDKIKQAIGHTTTINDLYEIKNKIGKGKFGIVRLGINRKTQEKVAIKILTKTEMTTQDLELVRTEIEILKICQHPYIITLYDVFETPIYIYIIMEYCSGGDLFSYLENRGFRLNEHKVCEFIHKTCSAVYYIHSYGIAHRDLKPENILLTTTDEDNADIRILDFGLSKIIGPDEQCTEPYGTLAYVAPEILLDQPYTKMVDLWSIGVMTYSMLSGLMPFDDKNDEEIVRQIVMCQPMFVGKKWRMVSKEAIDFVRRLLDKDQKKRMGIKEALEHEWIKKCSGKDYSNEMKWRIHEKGKGSEFELYSSAI